MTKITPTYEVWLSDPAGNRLALLDKFVRLSVVRVNNAAGTVQIKLPHAFDKRLAVKDGRIEVWRDAGQGPRLLTDTIFFIRGAERSMSTDGSKTFTITGYTPFYILQAPGGRIGRIVDAAAESAEAKKAAAIDDTMKAILRENIGASATAARDLSAYITIEADTTSGASITKEFARRNIGAVLSELHQQSAIDTPIIYYDFVSDNPTSIRFRTFPNLRGRDVSESVVFSVELGNVASYTLTEDYTNEITHASAGGRGVKGARVTASSTSARATDTPFNRREVFVNGGHFNTDDGAAAATGLSNEANAAVYAGRPQVRLEAQLVNTPQALYGLHWNYGDKIKVQVDELTFTAPIDAIAFDVQGGQETINAFVRVTTV